MKIYSKSELNKRAKFRCIHRHNGLNHNVCFDQANGLIEKIAYLDIETSSLNSDFGVVLSYCLLGDEDKKLYKRVITPEEITSGVFDRELLKQFCKDVRNYDRIITYYGFKFDVPYLRCRCEHHRLPFPIYKEISHTDAYLVVRRNFYTFHSRRLGTVAPFFGIKAKGHPLTPQVWIRCLSGNKDALAFVGTHNEEDVESLRNLWRRISKYTKLNRTSI